MINRVRRREDDNTSAAENLVDGTIEASDNLEVLTSFAHQDNAERNDDHPSGGP